jgi:hypothetical protein
MSALWFPACAVAYVTAAYARQGIFGHCKINLVDVPNERTFGDIVHRREFLWDSATYTKQSPNGGLILCEHCSLRPMLVMHADAKNTRTFYGGQK